MICAIITNPAQRVPEHEHDGKSLLHRVAPMLGTKRRRLCLPLCTPFLDTGRVELISLGMGGPAGDVLDGGSSSVMATAALADFGAGCRCFLLGGSP